MRFSTDVAESQKCETRPRLLLITNGKYWKRPPSPRQIPPCVWVLLNAVEIAGLTAAAFETELFVSGLFMVLYYSAEYEYTIRPTIRAE